MIPPMELIPVGDSAVTFLLNDELAARGASVTAELRRSPPAGVQQVTLAFGAVTISYDAAEMPTNVRPLDVIRDWVKRVATTKTEVTPEELPRCVELPVHYGGPDAPDLPEVAAAVGVTAAEVVRMHAKREYTVAAIGFLPGFAYLTGLPPRLRLPRRPTPRTRLPAGSVAVGGPYTGVYPVASPGGWHVIGRTDARLFDPADPSVQPLRVGDRVRFIPLARLNSKGAR